MSSGGVVTRLLKDALRKSRNHATFPRPAARDAKATSHYSRTIVAANSDAPGRRPRPSVATPAPVTASTHNRQLLVKWLSHAMMMDGGSDDAGLAMAAILDKVAGEASDPIEALELYRAAREAGVAGPAQAHGVLQHAANDPRLRNREVLDQVMGVVQEMWAEGLSPGKEFYVKALFACREASDNLNPTKPDPYPNLGRSATACRQHRGRNGEGGPRAHWGAIQTPDMHVCWEGPQYRGS